MSKFYIGQKLVAIKDHSQGIFKKGDEFTVLGIASKCKCGHVNLDVGFVSNANLYRCGGCRNVDSNFTDIWYISNQMFVPIELSTTTFEDVIKQLEPCLN